MKERSGVIRPARKDDLPVLRDIERAAGRVFAGIGMTMVAEDEPPTLATLLSYQQDGRAWVATDASDRPVAYLIADLVDGAVHIEQVSVHPDHSRKRLGFGLIEHVAGWAAERGAKALTMTTFTEVAWNEPYYERCGFRRLEESETTPGLRAIRQAEAAHGLDRWPRASMRRDL
jgi:GNAT superfamily N-acetyltransferase